MEFASDEKQCTIIYSDNAGGMDQQTYDKMFDPFFTTKEVGKGTGIGMSIVLQTIKEHNASIECETEKGKGTSFKIIIDRVDFQEKEEKHQYLSTSHGAKILKEFTSKQRDRIVLVDDEVDICEVFGEVLSDYFHVKSFTNPEEALEYCKNNDLDVLISDIKMPKLSGQELAREIRAEKPHLKILFISGHAESEVESILSENPGASFYKKPLNNLPDVIATIKEMLKEEHKRTG